MDRFLEELRSRYEGIVEIHPEALALVQLEGMTSRADSANAAGS